MPTDHAPDGAQHTPRAAAPHPVPSDPDVSAADVATGIWRAERRKVARQHHPDLGGDLETYLALTAKVDRQHDRRRGGAVSGQAGTAHLHVVSERGVRVTWRRSARRTLRRARRVIRAARAQLPPGTPGCRRYSTL